MFVICPFHKSTKICSSLVAAHLKNIIFCVDHCSRSAFEINVCFQVKEQWCAQRGRGRGGWWALVAQLLKKAQA